MAIFSSADYNPSGKDATGYAPPKVLVLPKVNAPKKVIPDIPALRKATYSGHPLYEFAQQRGVTSEAPDVYPADIPIDRTWQNYQTNKDLVIEDARLRSGLADKIGNTDLEARSYGIPSLDGNSSIYAGSTRNVRIKPLSELQALVDPLTKAYTNLGSTPVKDVSQTAHYGFSPQQKPISVLEALQSHWVKPEQLKYPARIDAEFIGEPNGPRYTTEQNVYNLANERQRLTELAKNTPLDAPSAARLSSIEQELGGLGFGLFDYKAKEKLGTTLIPATEIGGLNYALNQDKRRYGLQTEAGWTTVGDRIVRGAGQPDRFAMSDGEIDQLMAESVDPSDLSKPFNNKETNYRAANAIGNDQYYGGSFMLEDEYNASNFVPKRGSNEVDVNYSSLSSGVVDSVLRRQDVHGRNERYATDNESMITGRASNADPLQVDRLGNDSDIDWRTWQIGEAEESLKRINTKLGMEQDYLASLADKNYDPQWLTKRQAKTKALIADLEQSAALKEDYLRKLQPQVETRIGPNGETIKTYPNPATHYGFPGGDEVSQHVVDSANTRALALSPTIGPDGQRIKTTFVRPDGKETTADFDQGIVAEAVYRPQDVNENILLANRAKNLGQVRPLAPLVPDVEGHAQRLEAALTGSQARTEKLKEIIPTVYYGGNAQAIEDSIQSEAFSRGVIDRINPHQNPQIIVDQLANIDAEVQRRPGLIAPAVPAQKQFLPQVHSDAQHQGAGSYSGLQVNENKLRQQGWSEEEIARVKQQDKGSVTVAEAMLTDQPVKVPWTVPETTNNTWITKTPTKFGQPEPVSLKSLMPSPEPSLIHDVDTASAELWENKRKGEPALEGLTGLQQIARYDQQLNEINAALSDVGSRQDTASQEKTQLLLSRKKAIEDNRAVLGQAIQERSLAQGLKEGEGNLTNALRAETVGRVLTGEDETATPIIRAQRKEAENALALADLYVSNPALQRPLNTLDPTVQQAVAYKQAEQEAVQEFQQRLANQLAAPVNRSNVQLAQTISTGGEVADSPLAAAYVEPKLYVPPVDARYANYTPGRTTFTEREYTVPQFDKNEPLVYGETLDIRQDPSGSELSLREYNDRIKRLQIELGNEESLVTTRYKSLSDQLADLRQQRDSLISSQAEAFVPTRRGLILNPLDAPVSQDLLGQALEQKAARVAALQQDPDAIAYNRPGYTATSAPLTLGETQGVLAQQAENLGLDYTPKPVVGIELSDNYVPPRASTVTQGLNASLQGQLGATQLVQEAAKEYNTPYNKRQLVGINQHLADLQGMVDQIPVNAVDDVVESAAQSASQMTPRAAFSAVNRGIGRYALPIAAIAGAGIGGAALANAQRQAQMQREAQQRQGVAANFY